MGLDSVEMIMKWEKHFNIKIPDHEVEKIVTLQDATNYIANILSINKDNTNLREKVFKNIQTCLKDLNLISKQIEYEDKVSEVVFENKKQIWDKIAFALQLKIPIPYSFESNTLSSKIVSKLFPQKQNIFDNLLFSQLIDGICGNNYETLVDINNIQSKYEIYICIMGITEDIMGINIYELEPSNTFVQDLGLN